MAKTLKRSALNQTFEPRFQFKVAQVTLNYKGLILWPNGSRFVPSKGSGVPFEVSALKVAWARFKAEGFEVSALRVSLTSNGSRFVGRLDAI